MKERFWFVYYWLMVSYLAFALLTVVAYKTTETYAPTIDGVRTCAELKEHVDLYNRIQEKQGDTERMGLDCDLDERLERYADVNQLFAVANKILFFNFIYDSPRYATREIDNFYPFILVLLMTIIRFIFIGKHIWQRPESS